jgi:outer membrane cobalamin receptor
LRLRLENALDEKYQETQGYPLLPGAAYLSAEWRH